MDLNKQQKCRDQYLLTRSMNSFNSAGARNRE